MAIVNTSSLFPEKLLRRTLEPSDLEIQGDLAERLRRAVNRLRHEPPYSPDYILHSVSYKSGTLSHFSDWSGDLSGRWVYALTCAQRLTHENYPELMAIAEELLTYQHPDGHFGKPQPLSTTDRAQIYGNGWLLLGLTEHYLSTGDERFLNAARRLGDYYVATQEYWFDPIQRAKPPEFYAKDYANYLHALDGVVLLFRVTHDKGYLKLAKRMAESLLSFEESDHSHNFLSTRRGLLDLYVVTGDDRYLGQAEEDWARVVIRSMLPSGGVPERFKEPDRDEGCSEADWLRFNLQLWWCTGKTKYLDLAERILLNHFAYNQCDNGGFGHNRILPRFALVGEEAVWCCSMHGTHALATVPLFILAHTDEELFVNLFVSCTTTVPMLVPVQVTLETGYPASPDVTLHLDTARPTWFDLVIRIPAWAKLESLTVNGDVETPDHGDGSLRLRREWKSGDVVRFRFGYGLRLETAQGQVSVEELQPGRFFREASLWYGPVLLGHQLVGMHRLVLRLPVSSREELAPALSSEIAARLQSQSRCEEPLGTIMADEVLGDEPGTWRVESRRLVRLYPVASRRAMYISGSVIVEKSTKMSSK